MKRLSHRHAARADLAEIWLRTTVRWDIAQADAYLAKIDDVAQRLARGEAKGSMTRGRYRKRRAGAHILFYLETDEEISIVRVLHERMDEDRHLLLDN